MLYKAFVVLFVTGLLGTTVPGVALANDPTPNTKDSQPLVKKEKGAAMKAKVKGSSGAGAMSAPASAMKSSSTNPRANPDNDQNGPRASEPNTDATPSQGTSATQQTSTPR